MSTQENIIIELFLLEVLETSWLETDQRSDNLAGTIR